MVAKKKSNRKTEVDLEGRVRRLSFSAKTHVCRPLFEAIHNALDSIEDGDCTSGLITILIERDSAQLSLNLDDRIQAPIKNIVVSDNGKGFDDQNMKSFVTLDSQYKLTKGGKGIGRLSWLKAFERAEIESVYKTGSGYSRRKFVFGITGFTDEEITDTQDTQTGSTIRLVGYKPLYESFLRNKKLTTLANEIGRDFLPYLLFGKGCKIKLIDSADDETITKDDLPVDKETALQIGGHHFKVHHVRISSGEDSHRIFYCASGRSVTEEKLHDIGIQVGRRGKLKKEPNRDEFWYRAYVTSPYLDENVSSDRTNFDIEPEPMPLYEMMNLLSMSQIRASVKAVVEDYLEEPIAVLAKAKQQRVSEAFEEDLAPLSYILKNHKDELDNLPVDVQKDDIVKKVSQIHAEKHISTRQEATRVLNSLKGSSKPKETFEQIQSKMAGWLETYQADLAQYVLYRAWVLELLSTIIAKQSNGKFFKESDLHELICPMRVEGWTAALENRHNLWILDDKFSFFDYLASDVELAQYQTSEDMPDKDRPDVCTYLFSNSSDEARSNSIVIVEFKRPGRANLKDDKDRTPLEQVLEYIEKIRSGKIRDHAGMEIHADEQTIFFCYIVCDTATSQMKKMAKVFRMQPAFEGAGYYVHYEDEKAYIEVISMKKLLLLAKKRHYKLFSKLKLPPKILTFEHETPAINN